MFIKNIKNSKIVNIRHIGKTIANNKTNRICLHDNHNDTDQGMLIQQKRNYFYKPKKNLTSNQTFIILRGELLILILNNKGDIIKKVRLNNKNNLICRIKKNTYHCDIALKNNTLHYETTTHSFKKRKLQYLNNKSYEKFLNNLKKILKRKDEK